jgi:butyryl-CoA dehydrogenase
MRELAGRTAVVTGAASGIGRALAVELARHGMALALSDVNEAGLADTRACVAASGVRVTTERVDVADRAAVHSHADAVVATHGQVHLVVNNAGVGLSAMVSELTYDDFEWLMGINFWGVVHGTKAFLPHLLRAEEGHVVNVSSVFGLIGVPGQSAYNAAKFAVRGFTEALRQELDASGARVGATSVHPGGIRTNIARASRFSPERERWKSREQTADEFDRLARTSPEDAARAIVRGVRRNARRVLIGADAHVVDLVQRILPTGYQRLAVALGRRGGLVP